MLLNREYVEQETDRLEQRRNPREIILGCLSEGRECRSRIRYPLPAEYVFKNYLLRISDLFCLSFLLDKLSFPSLSANHMQSAIGMIHLNFFFRNAQYCFNICFDFLPGPCGPSSECVIADL